MSPFYVESDRKLYLCMESVVFTYDSAHDKVKLFFQLVGGAPYNVIVLSGVEVRSREMVLSYAPDDRKAEPQGVTRFKVDPVFVLGHICQQEARLSYVGYDLCVDPFKVWIHVNSVWFVSGISDRRADCVLPNRFHGLRK